MISHAVTGFKTSPHLSANLLSFDLIMSQLLGATGDTGCWGDLAAPPLVEEPKVPRNLTPAEEALENYVPPVLEDLSGLEEHFPVLVDREWGAFGVKRYIVRWDEDRVEDWHNWRLDEYNSYDHYTFYREWEEIRLRKTLSEYSYKFNVTAKGKGSLCTVTVIESLGPIELIKRFPFVWDQDGGRFGIRLHMKNLSECERLPVFQGCLREHVVNHLVQQLRAIAEERTDCIVEGSTREHLLVLRFPAFDLALPVKATTAPAPAPAPVPKAASLTTTAVPVPVPVAVVKRRALDVLRSAPVAWKRDNAYHTIEINRAKRDALASLPENRGKSVSALDRMIHDSLLATLRTCADCELLPPPRNSQALFVVRII
jgi:hypothetical protein